MYIQAIKVHQKDNIFDEIHTYDKVSCIMAKIAELFP